MRSVPPGRFGRTFLEPPTETVQQCGDRDLGDPEPERRHPPDPLPPGERADPEPASRSMRLTYTGGAPNLIGRHVRLPDPTELGWKETVQMHPGEVTRVIMKFELPAIKTAAGATVPRPVSPEIPWGLPRVRVALPHPRARGARHDETAAGQALKRLTLPLKMAADMKPRMPRGFLADVGAGWGHPFKTSLSLVFCLLLLIAAAFLAGQSRSTPIPETSRASSPPGLALEDDEEDSRRGLHPAAVRIGPGETAGDRAARGYGQAQLRLHQSSGSWGV